MNKYLRYLIVFGATFTDVSPYTGDLKKNVKNIPS